jgi:N-acyl-D-aspartate/D-glutamate deacylase
MPYDLIVRDGKIVDGTGEAAFLADIAIRDGKIVEIGKLCDGSARVIDAEGSSSAPDLLIPIPTTMARFAGIPKSPRHGTESQRLGNCGVGLAPCRPEDREIATWDLVNVEAIPFDVQKKGVTWDWETFPQYMDAADRRGVAINLAGR